MTAALQWLKMTGPQPPATWTSAPSTDTCRRGARSEPRATASTVASGPGARLDHHVGVAAGEDRQSGGVVDHPAPGAARRAERPARHVEAGHEHEQHRQQPAEYEQRRARAGGGHRSLPCSR